MKDEYSRKLGAQSMLQKIKKTQNASVYVFKITKQTFEFNTRHLSHMKIPEEHTTYLFFSYCLI